MASKQQKITVEIDPAKANLLKQLGARIGHRTAEDTLTYLLASLADGVRRPGSWEAQVVAMLFGP